MFYLYSGGPSFGIYDLWQFDPVDVKWSRINGSSVTSIFPVYGAQGIPSAANTPGNRRGGPGWISNAGDFYVFGGYVNSWQGTRAGNEMWKFTLDSNCINCTTAITEHGWVNGFSVYPNPAGSKLKISLGSANIKKIELSIYNALGKQIYFSKEEITKGKFEKEINVEKWSDGIYFLQVKTKEGNISRKVIVNHP